MTQGVFERTLSETGEPQPRTGRPYLRLFRQFRQLLDTRFTDDWTVADYARALSISEKTLTRVCTAIGGRPPAKLIEAHFLLESKRRRAHSDRTAAGVAAQLGFNEPTNFTKFFRRLTGMTPMVFRTSQRNVL